MAQPPEKTGVPASRKLTYRLVRNTLIIALLLGTLFSFAELLFDYRIQDAALDGIASDILETIENSATHIVWNLDTDGGRELASGLLKYRMIQKVEILDDREQVIAQAERPPGERASFFSRRIFGDYRTYSIELKAPHPDLVPGGKSRLLGVVRLRIDPAVAGTDFMDRSLFVLLSELVRNLVLAALLLFVFHLTVTRPLLRAGDALARLDPQNPGRRLLPTPQRNRRDELGRFVEKTNSLLQAVGANIERRERAEDEVKRALGAAEEARDRLDAILKSMADGLIVTDTANRVVLMNSAAEKLLNMPLGVAWQNPIDGVIGEKDFGDFLTSALSGEGAGSFAEWEIPPSAGEENGRVIQARLSLVPALEGGKRGVITILRDVTRERESDRMKNSFISVAAHELSTPLTSIMGYAEFLLSKEDVRFLSPEQKEEFLSTIYEKAEVLSGIVEDLLNLSRIESGQVIVLDKALCDPAGGVRELLSQYRERSPGYRFEADLPEPPVLVIADRGKVNQVWENLVSNAVKYSPKGGEVRVAGRLRGGFLELSVEDGGIGMTPEQKERIFDKFYRADTLNTAIGGLGLGMSIVKSIVEAHGGRIWVESEPGRGTKVIFSLPAGDGDSD